MSTRILIAGSRNFNAPDKRHLWPEDLTPYLNEVLQADGDLPNSYEIVTGPTIGADELAREYAMAFSHELHVFPFPPPIDNVETPDDRTARKNACMLEYILQAGHRAVLAIWDGGSTGTSNLIAQAKALGISCGILVFDPNSGYLTSMQAPGTNKARTLYATPDPSDNPGSTP